MQNNYLSLLPLPQLIAAMRDEQESVLWGLKDNVFAILAGYRLSCRQIIRDGTFPAYADLSRRLTMGVGRRGRSRGGAVLTGRTFATICRRLSVALRRAAESRLHLVSPKREVFAEDIGLERQRRERIYAAQVEKLDVIAARWSNADREGPSTKPVYCKDLDQWFDSARSAARFVSATMGREIHRKDIRTAIVRNGRCVGLKFSYEGPAQGKPSSRIVLAGHNLPVRCLEMEGPPFESRAKAAIAAGVSPAAMKKALDGDGRVGDFTYEYCKLDKQSVQVERSFAARFPGFVSPASHAPAPVSEQPKLFPESGGAVAVRFSDYPRKRKARRTEKDQLGLFAE